MRLFCFSMKYFQKMRLECFLHFWISKNVKFYVNDLGESASVMCFVADTPAMCSRIYDKKTVFAFMDQHFKGRYQIVTKGQSK